MKSTRCWIILVLLAISMSAAELNAQILTNPRAMAKFEEVQGVAIF